MRRAVAHTGVPEVHASLRVKTFGAMTFHREGVYMGGEKSNHGLAPEYGLSHACPRRVTAVLAALGRCVTDAPMASASP
jgi:hypothetical protein